MCGFVGLRTSDGAFDKRDGQFGEALSAIRHRGPDGVGLFQTDWLSIAHTRLSIIDLTEAARQPMQEDSGRYVIVFNGEIYNYRELAERFLANDMGVNRASDTSVLLAMYKRFGRDCLQYLDGMFAFAVADLQDKKLFLARDRFGEKPLYIFQASGIVAFASEISALRKLLPNEVWEIDPHSLMIYHMMGSIPAPRSIYRNVRAIQPGHWVEIDGKGISQEGCYWSLGQITSELGGGGISDYGEALDNCKHLLQQAVRSRMVSDVPIGVFLSGGIDSGSIMSLLASQGAQPVDALCMDFPEASFSEYHLAETTANAFGARLHRSTVTSEIFLDHLEDFFRVSDQPTMDGFNTYFVSKQARALGIKVWLSGVGGDELFGGYPSFNRLRTLKTLSHGLQIVLPSLLRKGVVRFLPNQLRLSRLCHLGVAGDPLKRAYQTARNPIPWGNLMPMLSDGTAYPGEEIVAFLDELYPTLNSDLDDFQLASILETGVYMGSQLLRDIDNFAMAHSIETRAPFLDHNLFAFVLGLPERFKMSADRKKPLLLEALANPLPDIITSQSKRGFTFPVESWLKQNMRQSFRECVLTERNAKLWDLKVIESMWNAYLNNKLHWSVLWNFYAMARWMSGHELV